MSAPASDTEVPAFWRDLALPGLADIQVQFLPPRMLRRVWEAGTPNIYKWSDEERVAHLQAMGVRAFTALPYAQQTGVAADLNAWTLDFAARTPGCVPSATFYPEAGVNRYTRTAIDSGARIFNARFEPAGINPAHALLDAVWGVLADAEIPVIMHAGAEQTGPARQCLDAIETVLRRHPGLTAVITHADAADYIDVIALTEKYERVCLDTSFAVAGLLDDRPPFPRAQLPRVRELGLAGKVLHGSDFPNLPYPYAAQLAALSELNLGDDWLRAVCWVNAANLLGLS